MNKNILSLYIHIIHPVLVFAGSGFERKGLEFAVRALAWLPASVRLEVAGKGNPTRHQRLAEELGVAARLRFLGSSTRMEDVYGGSDILVHPAIYEPFSNTCLEAMASGLPVVTSLINGASEIVVRMKMVTWWKTLPTSARWPPPASTSSIRPFAPKPAC